MNVDILSPKNHLDPLKQSIDSTNKHNLSHIIQESVEEENRISSLTYQNKTKQRIHDKLKKLHARNTRVAVLTTNGNGNDLRASQEVLPVIK